MDWYAQIPLLVQGHQFPVDFHVLIFSGTDTVLVVQWLATLGPITTDHSTSTMFFIYADQHITLQRLTHTSPPSPITLHQLQRLHKTDSTTSYLHIHLLHLLPITPHNQDQIVSSTSTTDSPCHPAIKSLFNQCATVFQTPHSYRLIVT